MAEYDNTNTGALFPNLDKDYENPDDQQPHARGPLDVEGKKYRIAVWEKISTKTGKPYTRVVIQPDNGEYEKKKADQRQSQQDEVVLEDIDNEPVDLADIPF